MIVAFQSQRARDRACTLLHKPLGYVYDWWRGPKAGFAIVTEEEFARIKHLPGITRARRRQNDRQLALLNPREGVRHV
jgi:hypothetical protein